jgi:renalase
VQDGEGWLVHLDHGVLRSQRVVVTVPAPQVVGLLSPDHPLVAAVSSVRMAPWLTLMAATLAPSPFISRQVPDDLLA